MSTVGGWYGGFDVFFWGVENLTSKNGSQMNGELFIYYLTPVALRSFGTISTGPWHLCRKTFEVHSLWLKYVVPLTWLALPKSRE